MTGAHVGRASVTVTESKQVVRSLCSLGFGKLFGGSGFIGSKTTRAAIERQVPHYAMVTWSIRYSRCGWGSLVGEVMNS